MNLCHRSSECHSFGDIQLQASVSACLSLCWHKEIYSNLFAAENTVFSFSS